MDVKRSAMPSSARVIDAARVILIFQHGSAQPHPSLDRFEPTEPNWDEFPSLELPCRALVDDSQQLYFFRSNRQYQASPWLELLKQSRRRPFSRHADQDLVEWGVLGPAARPVSDTNGDIGKAEVLQEAPPR